eukprot:1181768-Prorocentrum_minimum.AAC.1
MGGALNSSVGLTGSSRHRRFSGLCEIFGGELSSIPPLIPTSLTVPPQVSAGYDAHWRDPLAGLQFQSRTYHLLTSALKQLADQLCGGKIVFLLEVSAAGNMISIPHMGYKGLRG